MSNSFKVVDRGWNKIVDKAKKLSAGRAAFVGIQGSEAEVDRESYATNAEIASVMEFGTRDGRIPARPWLRQPFDDNVSKYEKELNDIFKDLLDLKDADPSLLVLGEIYRADVLEAVQSNSYEPWAESTAAKKELEGKSGDVVLWDTGQMVNSVSVVIGDRNEKKSEE